MKERLEKFIKTEGLTPSRFAEIMGVQPSSISHILGGRNKPSFDFIEKMLLRFPKINPDWLLLGKGTIYRSAEMGTTDRATPEVPRNNVLQEETPTVLAGTLPFENIPPSATAPEASPRPGDEGTQNSSTRTVNESAPWSKPTAPSFSQALNHIPEEQIEHIVVFLKDKTFISYRPK